MSLSSEEARAVFPIAWSLPPDCTADFVRAVELALASHPARGEGLAHRIAVGLMPKYFVPPPDPPPHPPRWSRSSRALRFEKPSRRAY
jgi:hypothetical protein